MQKPEVNCNMIEVVSLVGGELDGRLTEDCFTCWRKKLHTMESMKNGVAVKGSSGVNVGDWASSNKISCLNLGSKDKINLKSTEQK